MGGGKNITKTDNNSGGGGKSGVKGKGKGKESKKDEGKEGKLKPATAINSRHILVSPPLSSFSNVARRFFLPWSVCVCVCACVRGLNETPRRGGEE